MASNSKVRDNAGSDAADHEKIDKKRLDDQVFGVEHRVVLPLSKLLKR